MKNKKHGFSLIELSIVILIIGILIAGVTQGSRLVGASKVQTAQTSTQSSPVSSVQGLVLWLETSNDKSFLETEIEDEHSLTRWNDTNPQATHAGSFTIATGTEDITYEANGINGLPSVQFDGTQTVPFAGDFISNPYAAYTFFIVHRVKSITTEQTLLYNGVLATNGFGIGSSTAGKTLVDGGTSGFTAETGTDIATANEGQITTVTIGPDSILGVAQANPEITIYVDGAAALKDTLSKNIVTPTGSMYIGNKTTGSASTPLAGEISEIIVFDHVLKTKDRQSIEAYLGKKFAISVSKTVATVPVT